MDKSVSRKMTENEELDYAASGHVIPEVRVYGGMRATCEECCRALTLTTVDADGVLIGDECPNCGYYVTRYMPGQEPR